MIRPRPAAAEAATLMIGALMTGALVLAAPLAARPPPPLNGLVLAAFGPAAHHPALNALMAALAGAGAMLSVPPRTAARLQALSGLALAGAGGAPLVLLCLCVLGAARAILRLGTDEPLPALIATGLWLGPMPLVDAAGLIFALCLLPLLAACLPAPLIVGRAAGNALLIVALPALSPLLGFGLLAWRHDLALPLLPATATGVVGAGMLLPLALTLPLAGFALLPGHGPGRPARAALCLLPGVGALLFALAAGARPDLALAVAPAVTVSALAARDPSWPALVAGWGAAAPGLVAGAGLWP